MLLNTIFKEFISVVQENPKYTIGLLSDEGEVVSCSKDEFVGITFDINKPRYNDTFYVIEVKNMHYGYLWVNGDDPSLPMISNLLLDSLKTRIMYEVNEKTLKRKLTKDDKLVKALLEENIEPNHVLSLVKDMGVNKDTPRVALHITNANGFDIDEIKGIKLRLDSKQMFYSLLDKHNLLIFKDIPVTDCMESTKEYLVEYVESLKEWGLQNCAFSIGSIQNRLVNYVTSYNNCLWLEKNNYLEINKPVFFMDLLFNYYISSIESSDILSIFDYYKRAAKGFDVDELLQVSKQLLLNDYNITQTAQDLYLHKNTLIYKIKRYEEIFNIDIRGSFQGKALFSFIAYAMQENEKQRLVGD